MAHQLTQKEVYLLSGPSELQPVNDRVTQYTPREEDLLQPPDVSEAQESNTDTTTDKAQLQSVDRK